MVRMTKERRGRKPKRSPGRLRSRSIHMSALWEMWEPGALRDVLTAQLRRLCLLVSRRPMSLARSVLLKPYYGSAMTEDAEAMSAKEKGVVVSVVDCRTAGKEEQTVQEVARSCCTTNADPDGCVNVPELLSKTSSDAACLHLQRDSKAS